MTREAEATQRAYGGDIWYDGRASNDRGRSEEFMCEIMVLGRRVKVRVESTMEKELRHVMF